MLDEKYRPTILDEIIGQDQIVATLSRIADDYEQTKDFSDMMFLGPPGTGKTTAAQCFTRALFGVRWREYYIEMNASDERNIETVRTKIKRIARSSTLDGMRILFLDEFDAMTTDAQNALRRIIETAPSTRFILTGNREHKIIDPIKSRCVIFRFRRIDDQSILRQILKICREEKVKIDGTSEVKEGLKMLVEQSDGDLRRAIKDLEKLIKGTTQITKETVLLLQEIDLGSQILIQAMDGDFETARKTLEDAYITTGFSHERVIQQLYKAIAKVTQPELRIKLFTKLAEVDHNCQSGGHPLVQLVSFVAFPWIIKHLPRECPARK